MLPRVGDRVVINEETWTPPEAPAGAVVRTQYAYGDLFAAGNTYAIDPEEEVRTIQADFAGIRNMDISAFRNAIEAVRTNVILSAPIGQIVAYVIWETPSTDQLEVPQQICLIPPAFACITPPAQYQGQTITEFSNYRIWILIRQSVAQNMGLPPEGGPQRIGPFLALILIFFATVVAPLIILGIFQVTSGKTTFRNMIGDISKLLQIPGENIKAAVSPGGNAIWGLGLLFLGVAALSGSGGFKFPSLSTSVGLPIGRRGSVQLGTGGGGGGGATVQQYQAPSKPESYDVGYEERQARRYEQEMRDAERDLEEAKKSGASIAKIEDIDTVRKEAQKQAQRHRRAADALQEKRTGYRLPD